MSIDWEKVERRYKFSASWRQEKENLVKSNVYVDVRIWGKIYGYGRPKASGVRPTYQIQEFSYRGPLQNLEEAILNWMAEGCQYNRDHVEFRGWFNPNILVNGKTLWTIKKTRLGEFFHGFGGHTGPFNLDWLMLWIAAAAVLPPLEEADHDK